MSDTSVVVCRKRINIELTADDIGHHLAGETVRNQAAMLIAWAKYTAEWVGGVPLAGRMSTWDRQCRAIAWCLSADERTRVAGVLEPLLKALTETEANHGD